MVDPEARIGMKPPHACSFICAEIMDELNRSMAKVADVLGVRRATLYDLVDEKATLLPEVALWADKAFGVSMDALVRLQAWHDSHAMRQRADELDVKRCEPARGSQARGSGSYSSHDMRTARDDRHYGISVAASGRG